MADRSTIESTGPDGAEPADAAAYAVSGESVPAALLQDEVFARAFMSARAEADTLREGLEWLTRELADECRPQPRSIRRRRGVLALAAGIALLMLCGGATGAYMMYGGESRTTAEASLSAPGYVACARTIVIGTVTAVHGGADGTDFSVDLDVERYLKPSTGDRSLAIEVVGADDSDRTSPADWRVGTRVLVTVLRDGDSDKVDQRTGKDIDTAWAWMTRALPESTSVTCADENN